MHNTLITEHVILRFLSSLFLPAFHPPSIPFCTPISPARDRTHRSATLHRFALTPPPDIEKRLIVRYTLSPPKIFAPLLNRRKDSSWSSYIYIYILVEYVTFRYPFFLTPRQLLVQVLLQRHPSCRSCSIEREISIIDV